MWQVPMLMMGVSLYILMKKGTLSYAYRCLLTLPRDMGFLFTLGRWNLNLIAKKSRRPWSMLDELSVKAKHHPDQPALVGLNGVTFTFAQLEAYTNRIANFVLSQRWHERGGVVVLLMENCPEYIALWLGIAKAGMVCALQNYNIAGEQLLHCLKTANSGVVIVSPKYYHSIRQLDSDLDVNVYVVGGGDPLVSCHKTAPSMDPEVSPINSLILEQSDESPDLSSYPNLKRQSFDDILYYIYTSGTTGMPKAVRVSHRKLYTFSVTGSFLGVNNQDKIYVFLPLYHISGGGVAVTQCLCYGATLVIREKFSTSNFAKDCATYNVTGFNYVGEVCRYLVTAPPHAAEKNLSLRIAFGNGLRREHWEELRQRYNIGRIAEFYGSTEGNVSMINYCNQPGACGFVPMWSRPIAPFCIVKCDLATGEILRNDQGRVTLCDFNQPGHMVGMISKYFFTTKIDGYTSASATNAKLLRDAFADDDLYFMTGDIMKQDEFGFMYFVDRLGDTFRWKGENVSTMEVESIISKQVDNRDVIAYGVPIPGHPGCAGMINVVEPFDDKILGLLEALAKAVKCMPVFQRPLFVRISSDFPATETFKYQKATLKKQGFDLSLVQDPLYYYDTKANVYAPLTEDVYQDIMSSKLF